MVVKEHSKPDSRARVRDALIVLQAFESLKAVVEQVDPVSDDQDEFERCVALNGIVALGVPAADRQCLALNARSTVANEGGPND